jgi:16S rRNA (cytidine1402-2'-O)-methyltransferase
MRPPPPIPSTAPLAPGLYVVATPIGNLRDMTLRAIDILAAADVVLAEDTRVAAKLLSAFDLKARVERYDDHTDARRRPQILELLQQGGRIALISDAGTPLVSDPGYRLVAAAAEAGVSVFAAPGASAALAALAVSGLPTDRFLFAGFTPPKSAARRATLQELAPIRATLILYETGPRLAESLADMLAVFGDRPAVVARELTKLHETVVRGPLSVLVETFSGEPPRGEIVVLIGPGTDEAVTAADADTALREALSRAGPAEAAGEVARALGLNRRALYRRALELKDGS